MLQAQTTRQVGSSCTHERIVQAAIRLYRAIGYRKTTVADVARGASMSPANLYRFYPSRQALEEAVVAELLDEVSAAAASAPRRGGSGLDRLSATLITISQRHEHRLTHDLRLHELVVAAGQANWPIALSHADGVRGLVQSIIAAGQASGEFRAGSPMVLACCLLDAMDAYLNPSRIKAHALRPAFGEMMSFCAEALSNAASVNAASSQVTGIRVDLLYKPAGRT
ncbi:AcrR family transcriptional regulator [Bradyrhizobium ottawaense]|uniref:TetR/AcrR family transcriptional regulator n=1 Tax=Bradyrhizobium ottawaense TaxID=931866 RepID=A0A2U8PKC5_9BRAD|nr:TetR/AcrR family transcriptional regulator [Bradyrhizobium ottawaense]MBR1330916.1 TetR/AcrR family transcriptional regulator [Bradyrhizobium ottawaense]MBR1337719.1 TetR/AcrR family transcriptional regulator [Bradyrhizobium ottawaense]MBR1362010.1 TetR/AcrR family transcriptional regulator [Bradyrhizobium ottawaense]